MKIFIRLRSLFPAFALIVAINGEMISQTVQFGTFTSGTNLVINVRPSAGIIDTLTGVLFTVRWPDSVGVSLGDVTTAYGMEKGSIETVSGIYRYQEFYQAVIPKPFNWIAGVDYPIVSVPVIQTGSGPVTLELAPAGFLEGGEGDPYVEINFADRTNLAAPFYQNTITIALPVELTSFTVRCDKQGATLIWNTATESNNAGFDVERTAIGTPEGKKKWTTLGFVNGSGTTNAPKQYVYKNKNVQSGKYAYRLKQVDRDGAFKYSQEVEAEIAAPDKFTLTQNYPNPFNPSTMVNFSLAQKSLVAIKMYDVTGREVRTVLQEEKDAGYYSVTIDGASLSSGVYFYRITAAHNGTVFTDTRRMMLLK